MGDIAPQTSCQTQHVVYYDKSSAHRTALKLAKNIRRYWKQVLVYRQSAVVVCWYQRHKQALTVLCCTLTRSGIERQTVVTYTHINNASGARSVIGIFVSPLGPVRHRGEMKSRIFGENLPGSFEAEFLQKSPRVFKLFGSTGRKF